MKHRCCCGSADFHFIRDIRKVFYITRSTACDQRKRNIFYTPTRSVGYRKPCLRSIFINRRKHDLTASRSSRRFAHPDIQAGFFAAGVNINLPGISTLLRFDRSDNTLRTENTRRFGNKIRVAYGSRVESNLIGTGLQRSVDIVEDRIPPQW